MELSTNTWILIILFSIFIYCNIGYLFAHISWKIWYKIIINKNINNSNLRRKITKYWYIYLIFPISFLDPGYNELMINRLTENEYKLGMIFFWPIKVMINIVNFSAFCVLIGLIYGIIIMVIQFGKFLTWPVRKAFKINSI